MIKTVALVVAAGRGQRFGGNLPKQYAPLGAHTVLYHTVSRLLAHPAIDAVKCVIHQDDLDLYGQAVEGLDLLEPVFGGATRQDSVRLGLQSLTEQNPELVLIHDAARPFVHAALIDGVVQALATHKGALPAVAVADTLKRGQDGKIVETVARHGLYRAQTPQGFHFKDILAAHTDFSRVANGPEIPPEITDDAQLFEQAGLSVVLTPGDEGNFKITTQEDMMRAHNQLTAHRPAAGEFRTGQGFDVHRFGPGTQVTLCGIDVAHSHGLEGHSDADVALHALTDALLGAIGAGDIGTHFPPTDKKWKGAASPLFVAHAVDLIHKRGGEIVNVDITLICEAPKIEPHREAMVVRVAEILGLAPDRVSVKATTTEGLGFTGRREGIGAQAIASIQIESFVNYPNV